ncbi:aliphatic nitrilase [Paenarthrobacter ureafaciens]|uniref:carbon-nitrogen hydrolase family protein n=1 Tax=Paenarthrobacter ureafaciens TaxID=37931 RepID=UPI0015BDF1BD|nr:aliphatic nitrilase [Paenarthrobacter ureafaciens]
MSKPAKGQALAEFFGSITAAAVQASPVFLDLQKSTTKACELIREAGSNGAKFIVFPEGFLPGHPTWFHFQPVSSPISNELNLRLFKNAIRVPGPEVDAIAEAARDAEAYVVMGVCERASNAPGSLINSQLFFGPDGQFLGKHQKLQPTAGERIVHWGGWGDTLGPFQTEFGPASALVCGENSNPLEIFALTAAGTRLHGMSWPPHFRSAADGTSLMPQTSLLAAQNFALMSKAFVISACGIAHPGYAEDLGLTAEAAERISSGAGQGGSAIIGPDTRILAGPLDGTTEGILYAELDFDQWARQKIAQDFAGHYNRNDIFQLRVNRKPPTNYVTADNTATVEQFTERLEPVEENATNDAFVPELIKP